MPPQSISPSALPSKACLASLQSWINERIIPGSLSAPFFPSYPLTLISFLLPIMISQYLTRSTTSGTPVGALLVTVFTVRVPRVAEWSWCFFLTHFAVYPRGVPPLPCWILPRWSGHFGQEDAKGVCSIEVASELRDLGMIWRPLAVDCAVHYRDTSVIPGVAHSTL